MLQLRELAAGILIGFLAAGAAASIVLSFGPLQEREDGPRGRSPNERLGATKKGRSHKRPQPSAACQGSLNFAP
jgi:hypothetical protein